MKTVTTVKPTKPKATKYKTRILMLHGWMSSGWNKAGYMSLIGYRVACPKLDNWNFENAVEQAQHAFDKWKPDVIVGASRGGAIALHMGRDIPVVLMAPAWKYFGNPNSIYPAFGKIIHSKNDMIVPFSASRDLSHRTGMELILAGCDHRLNCRDSRIALGQALLDVHPEPEEIKTSEKESTSMFLPTNWTLKGLCP